MHGDEVAREVRRCAGLREPELTVQCRGWLPWRGLLAGRNPRVEGRGVRITQLGLGVVEHHVGGDPALVPLATLELVQRVDAAVLAGVVHDVTHHSHVHAVRDMVAGAVVCAELGRPEDLHPVGVVHQVLDAVGCLGCIAVGAVAAGGVASADDGVATLVGRAEGAGAAARRAGVAVDGGVTAGRQQCTERQRSGGHQASNRNAARYPFVHQSSSSSVSERYLGPDGRRPQ